MLVCICNGISDKDIDSALQDGATNFQEVRRSTGLGSCCGQCASFARDMVNEKAGAAQTRSAFHLAEEIRI